MKLTDKHNEEKVYITETYIEDDYHFNLRSKFNILNLKTGKMLYKPNGPVEKWFDETALDYGNKNFKCAQVKMVINSSTGSKDYYNYIDYNGNVLYKPNEPKKWFIQADLFYFNFDIARVYTSNDHCNIIDTKGNILYKPNEPKKWPMDIYVFDKYGWATAYMYNDKYNFINFKGELLYKPNEPSKWFDSAEIHYEDNFNEAYFNVTIDNVNYKLDRKGDLYGYAPDKTIKK